MKDATLLFVLAVLLFAASCGQVGTISQPPPPPLPTPLPPNVTAAADPQGDAGPTPTWDIVELRSERGLTTLDIRLWLTTDPILPAPGSLAGAGDMMFQIGFNSDLSRSTGTSFGFQCASAAGQGLDFMIDGGFVGPRNSNGTFNLRRTTGGLPIVGPVTASQSGPYVTFTVQYSAFGGTFAGRSEVIALVGFGPPGAPSWRDCAPDAGQALPTRRD